MADSDVATIRIGRDGAAGDDPLLDVEDGSAVDRILEGAPGPDLHVDAVAAGYQGKIVDGADEAIRRACVLHVVGPAD